MFMLTSCLLLLLFFWFFETGLLCVALVPVLELALVGQAGLELTEICLPLPPSAGIKGLCHHHLTHVYFLL